MNIELEATIEIVTLQPDEWQEYKNIRIEALQNEPQAFGANYEDALKKPDEEWIDRVKAAVTENKDIMLFARVDGKIVGMIGAYFHKSPETETVGNIWGVYVSEAYRGKGVAKKLMEKLLERLRAKGLHEAKLEVNVEQSAALGLYQKMGFVIVEKLEKALVKNGKYYNEYRMRKIFQ